MITFIIFFGTPHRGSDKAVYGKVLANVAQTVTPKYVGTDYRYTVYTTWQVSLDKIGSSHDDISQHALVIL